MKKIVISLFIILLLTTIIFAEAIPKKINFQGRVTDNNNIPYNGSYSMTFRIYDSLTGGNLLWNETQNNITVVKGLYSILLGSATDINLLFDKAYYMTVELNSNGEITPRIPIVPVGYAFRAIYSDTATNAVNAQTSVTSQNSLLFNNYSSDSFVKKSGDTITGNITVNGTLNATYLKGNGSQITNIYADSVQWANVINKPTNISTFVNDSNFASVSYVNSTVINTSSFALKTEIGIDTSSADKRYLSINADTMYADWNKISNKPNLVVDTSNFILKADSIVITKISQIQNDSGFITQATVTTQLSNIKTDTAEWLLVNNRPTALSSFLNDSGFITSAASGISQANADLRYLSISADTMNADWTKIINKPTIVTDSSQFVTRSSLVTDTAEWSKVNGRPTNLSAFANDSNFATLSIVNSQLSIKSDSPHTHLISNITDSIPYSRLTGTPNIPDTAPYLLKSDTVNFITTSTLNTQLANKSDSPHSHLVINITDSIPYSRISGHPSIPDTAPYLLKTDSVVITKISQLQNDSNFIDSSYVNNRMGDTNIFLKKTDSIFSDSIANLTITDSDIFDTANISPTKIRGRARTYSDSISATDISTGTLGNSVTINTNHSITTSDTVYAQFFVGNGKMLTGVLKLTDVISADSISGGTLTGNITINTNKPITTTDNITANKFYGDGSGLTNIPSSGSGGYYKARMDYTNSINGVQYNYGDTILLFSIPAGTIKNRFGILVAGGSTDINGVSVNGNNYKLVIDDGVNLFFNDWINLYYDGFGRLVEFSKVLTPIGEQFAKLDEGTSGIGNWLYLFKSTAGSYSSGQILNLNNDIKIYLKNYHTDSSKLYLNNAILFYDN